MFPHNVAGTWKPETPEFSNTAVHNDRIVIIFLFTKTQMSLHLK